MTKIVEPSSTGGSYPLLTKEGIERRPAMWGSICTPDEIATVQRVIADPGSALRCRTPQEAMLRVEPYLGDFGITRVAHLTWLDRVGIPVHSAHKPMGSSLSNGSGKGVTADASRIGAIMEAIEQTYWEESEIESVRCSREELLLEGRRHCDPMSVPVMRGALYQDDLALDWSPMIDLVSGEEVLAPASLVGLPKPKVSTRVCHMPSSNGLASGNNIVEAILSGLTESLERDALALMKAAEGRPQRETAGNLDDLRERMGEPLASLLDKFEAADLGFAINDSSGPVGVPTYKGIIFELGDGAAGSFGGYGTHLDPDVAIIRALTECAQSRGLIIAGARDDVFKSSRDAAMMASRQDKDRERAVDIDARAPLPDRENLSTGSIIDDVELLLGVLQANGLDEALVHRFTQEGDPAQVVRVLVPGLEGYMFRNYTPGPRARKILESTASGAAQ